MKLAKEIQQNALRKVDKATFFCLATTKQGRQRRREMDEKKRKKRKEQKLIPLNINYYYY